MFLHVSRMRREGFSFNCGTLRVELCSLVVVFEFATVRNRPQLFATVLKCSNPAPMALPLGRAVKSDFSWPCHMSVCAAIPLWFAENWYVMQERWCISLRRRRVSWKWHVCVVVTLGFAVSEWCFRGVESRCYIGICSCKVAWKAPFLWHFSGKTSILKKACESRSGRNHSKRWEKLEFWMSWGKWRKSFFVAGAAHCRLEGWKGWFRCTGKGIRESDAFASQLHWDLQFQSGVFEVLHRAATLRFAMQIVCSEVRFCEKSRVKRSFWKLGLPLLVKVSWKMLVLQACIVTFSESLVATLVLEAWIVAFGESLVENASFESLDSHFWWKSRGKCSFWKLGFSLLVKVSWKTLVLESLLVKVSWKMLVGFSLVVKVSWKMLVSEAWILTFRESLMEMLVLKASLVVSTKSVQQECPDKKANKSVKQECQERVWSKSVKQECPARVSSRSVL